MGKPHTQSTSITNFCKICLKLKGSWVIHR